MTTLTSPAADGRQPEVRRAIDVVLATIVLLLAAPLLLLLAVLVRFDSPGPVLFRQTRVGFRGREFEMLKLRSMTADADAASHRDHVRRLIDGSGAPLPWSPLHADPRVTRVGRYLRRTGLDEVPQLVNVLRGDMNLVGPRPALPYEASMWDDWHRRRLDVPPGITGLWQVDGRGAADFDTMVRLDIEYIERRSLALDLTILARTPLSLLRRWGLG